MFRYYIFWVVGVKVSNPLTNSTLFQVLTFLLEVCVFHATHSSAEKFIVFPNFLLFFFGLDKLLSKFSWIEKCSSIVLNLGFNFIFFFCWFFDRYLSLECNHNLFLYGIFLSFFGFIFMDCELEQKCWVN